MVMQDSGLLQQGCDITGALNINADANKSPACEKFRSWVLKHCSLEKKWFFNTYILSPPTLQLTHLGALHFQRRFRSVFEGIRSFFVKEGPVQTASRLSIPNIRKGRIETSCNF
jgi:hypothetical protein